MRKSPKLVAGAILVAALFVSGAVIAQAQTFDFNQFLSQFNFNPADGPIRFMGVVQEATDVGYEETIQDGYPFFRVYSFGNNFVALGAGCIANPKSGYRQGDGGLYLLDSQGNVLDSRNVCTQDEGGRLTGEQGLNPSFYIHKVGENRFVVPGIDTHPPRMYEIENNTLRFISRAYDVDDLFDREDDGEVVSTGDGQSAVVGNYYFEDMHKGRSRGMAIFRLPSFELVDFVESFAQNAQFAQPIAGVGDFLILQRTSLERIGGRDRSVPYADVYRVNPDGSTTFLQTLGRFFVYSHARDTSNPNRIALVVADTASRYERVTEGNIADPPDTELKIYTANSSGLSLETTSIKNEMNTTTGMGILALKGDVIAYVGTGEDFRTTVGSEDFQLLVEEGSELLEVEGFFEEDIQLGNSSVAISSGGQILVTAEQGRVLGLFSLGGLGAVPPTQPPTTPPGGFNFGNFQPPTLEFFLDIATQYVNQIRDIFSGGGTSGASLCTQPLTSEGRIREFQCRTEIVCSGTPTTTGYGNLGPITRAKWQEVCGTDPLTGGGGGGSQEGLNQDNQVQGASISVGSNFLGNVSSGLQTLYEAGLQFLR